jgi:ribosomal protein S18 acetylase RimI-like enzyme
VTPTASSSSPRRAVGYALVTIGEGPQGWAAGDRVADVQTLSVLSVARGEGVGTLLMDAVEEELSRVSMTWSRAGKS